MAVPLLPLLHPSSTPTNAANKNKNNSKSGTFSVLLKWVTVIIFIYAFLRWTQFFGVRFLTTRVHCVHLVFLAMSLVSSHDMAATLPIP
jgi:hypothetical protein